MDTRLMTGIKLIETEEHSTALLNDMWQYGSELLNF